MTDMRGEVARAICRVNGGEDCRNCDGEIQRFKGVDGRGRKHQRRRPCPYREDAKAAIEAHEKALEAEGLVIVPREPTEAMVHAGRYPMTSTVTERWQAMIAALEGKDAD